MVSARLVASGAAAMLVAGTAVMLVGCERGPTLEEDLAAIEAVNATIVSALNEGDLELLNSTVADNHIMMIPNRPEIVGREAVLAANQNLIASWDNVEIWMPAETVVAGDWAYQRGEYDITLTPKRDGVQPIRSIGKYIHIYERQPDGSWLMIRDIFNANSAE